MTRRNGYFYYERTEEGKQYTVHCRRVVKDESSTSTGGAWGSSLEQACCLPCRQCCCRCDKGYHNATVRTATRLPWLVTLG